MDDIVSVDNVTLDAVVSEVLDAVVGNLGALYVIAIEATVVVISVAAEDIIIQGFFGTSSN